MNFSVNVLSLTVGLTGDTLKYWHTNLLHDF